MKEKSEKEEPTLFTLEYYGFDPDGEWEGDEQRERYIEKFWKSDKYNHWKKHKFCEMNRDGYGYRYPDKKGVDCRRD